MQPEKGTQTPPGMSCFEKNGQSAGIEFLARRTNDGTPPVPGPEHLLCPALFGVDDLDKEIVKPIHRVSNGTANFAFARKRLQQAPNSPRQQADGATHDGQLAAEKREKREDQICGKRARVQSEDSEPANVVGRHRKTGCINRDVSRKFENDVRAVENNSCVACENTNRSSENIHHTMAEDRDEVRGSSEDVDRAMADSYKNRHMIRLFSSILRQTERLSPRMPRPRIPRGTPGSGLLTGPRMPGPAEINRRDNSGVGVPVHLDTHKEIFWGSAPSTFRVDVMEPAP